MDQIEEFLQWVCYIIADGSLYERTVRDDLIHGKGVYVSDKGLMRCTSEYSQCKQCKHQLPSWLLLYINSGSNNEDYGQRGCDPRGNHNHRQPMRKIPMKKSQNISSSSKRIH